MAFIAENHLSQAAADSVLAILDGRSPVYWANWLDNASHTPEYAYTKTWHYKNIDEGVDYADAPLNPKGDVVTAIREQIYILSDSVSTRAQKALALKILIHCVGDMHQPMHMGSSLRPRWQPCAGAVLRPRCQSPRRMGRQHHELGPCLELYRVATQLDRLNEELQLAEAPATSTTGQRQTYAHAHGLQLLPQGRKNQLRPGGALDAG